MIESVVIRTCVIVMSCVCVDYPCVDCLPVDHLYCQMLSARCCAMSAGVEVAETVEEQDHTKAVETMVEQDHATWYDAAHDLLGQTTWDNATHDLLGLVQLCLWAWVLCSSVL